MTRHDLSRRPTSHTLAALATLVISGGASAADATKGAEFAVQCAACHGAAGVSTAAEIPNLAAQKADYLAAQLTAFRAGERKNALMNAIAASLSDEDIGNLAAHFSALGGAAPGEVSPNASALHGALPTMPTDVDADFTRYDTLDQADRGQVRHYLANAAALEAAEAGGDFPDGAYLLVEIHSAEMDDAGAPVVDADGRMVAGELVGWTAMEKIPGAGADVPAIVRNGNWRYAAFDPKGENRDVNEASCLACHKPLTSTDYSFTYETLQAFAANR